MRYFLKFVSCCITPEVSTNDEVVTAVTPPKREEPRSLRPPKVAAVKKKKKRVRVGTPGSMTPEWKPSLYVISEDNVMAEKKEKTPPEAMTKTEEGVVKRKSTTGSCSKVQVRSYGDDIWRSSVPVVIPAFSPTPFMF